MTNFKISNPSPIEQAAHIVGSKKKFFMYGRKLHSVISFSKALGALFFMAALVFAEVFYTQNKKQAGFYNLSQPGKPAASPKNTNPPDKTTGRPDVAPTSTPVALGSINLPIPFTPQAPTGNWDHLHNEACEEASAIMANAYLTGDKDELIPPKQVEIEISALTAWQDQNFGYHFDTSAEQTAKMIQGFYGLTAKVQAGFTLQNIKDELANHHVVILPVNGRLLHNPNYKKPGPIYHMLVIRGYGSAGLITNDAGTRNGKNYVYPFNTLFNAGADWSHAVGTIDQTKKVMIIVSK